MKIKSGGNKAHEMIYIGIAVFTLLLLAYYLFSLVFSMSKKAMIVFGPEEKVIATETFRFNEYDALVQKIYPNKPQLLSSYQSSVATSSTTTVPTSTSR